MFSIHHSVNLKHKGNLWVISLAQGVTLLKAKPVVLLSFALRWVFPAVWELLPPPHVPCQHDWWIQYPPLSSWQPRELTPNSRPPGCLSQASPIRAEVCGGQTDRSGELVSENSPSASAKNRFDEAAIHSVRPRVEFIRIQPFTPSAPSMCPKGFFFELDCSEGIGKSTGLWSISAWQPVIPEGLMPWTRRVGKASWCHQGTEIHWFIDSSHKYLLNLLVNYWDEPRRRMAGGPPYKGMPLSEVEPRNSDGRTVTIESLLSMWSESGILLESPTWRCDVPVCNTVTFML